MAAGQDRSRFMKLYLAVQAPVQSYLLALLRNGADADDVFQEVSLVLWEKFGEYDDRHPFLAWALGIARNHAARWRRSRARVRVWLPPEVEEKLAATQVELEDELAPGRRALRHCVEKLGVGAREILDLRYGKAWSLQQIAAARGMTLNAVNKALGKVRVFLADCAKSAQVEGS